MFNFQDPHFQNIGTRMLDCCVFAICKKIASENKVGYFQLRESSTPPQPIPAPSLFGFWWNSDDSMWNRLSGILGSSDFLIGASRPINGHPFLHVRVCGDRVLTDFIRCPSMNSCIHSFDFKGLKVSSFELFELLSFSNFLEFPFRSGGARTCSARAIFELAFVFLARVWVQLTTRTK